VITFMVPEKVPMESRLSLGIRLENAAISYIIYLRQAIYPSGLAVVYPNPTDHFPIWQVAGALGLMGIVFWAVLVFRRERPYLAVGWLWYLGMLVPVIGIVQVSYSAAHADRYTYLPQIGLYLMVTWWVADFTEGWRKRRLLLGGLSVIILSALICAARIQVSYWKNAELLWNHTLATTTNNYIAHNNLGNTLKDQGKLDAAISRFQSALQIKPDYAEAHNNLGNTLARIGQTDQAMVHLQEALKINPDKDETHNNLGNVLAAGGRLDAAIVHYWKAIEINPGNANAYNNLGIALVRIGQIDTAIVQFQKALEIDPGHLIALNNLGKALAGRGQYREAAVHFQRALEIDPGYAAARNNLETILRQHR
jgi:tetratricopeptide (TPR) repeat protein